MILRDDLTADLMEAVLRPLGTRVTPCGDVASVLAHLAGQEFDRRIPDMQVEPVTVSVR